MYENSGHFDFLLFFIFKFLMFFTSIDVINLEQNVIKYIICMYSVHAYVHE